MRDQELHACISRRVRDPVRGIEFQPDFTAGSCCVGDPELRVDFNTGCGIPCGIPGAVPGTSYEVGSSTWDPPLARMEHELHAGFNGGPGTSHGVRNSMRDPMLQYGIQAGSSDLVGMWAFNEGCNAGQRMARIPH